MHQFLFKIITLSIVSAIFLVSLLAACGGSGSKESQPTNEAGSLAPSSQWTYPSGYVHLVGTWSPKNEKLIPHTMHQAAYKMLFKQCNALRLMLKVAEQPELPADKQALMNRVDTWFYYDQATSAARKEVHGPTAFVLTDLERATRDMDAAGANALVSVRPPDCTKVEERLARKSTIWTWDNKRYEINYNATSKATQVEQIRDDATPRQTAPQAGEARAINVGGSIEKCYSAIPNVMPNLFPIDKLMHHSKCIWDRYANVIFRNLPMPLEEIMDVGNDRLTNIAVEVSPTIPAAAGPWGPEPFYEVPKDQH